LFDAIANKTNSSSGDLHDDNKLVAFFHASEIQRGFRKNVNERLKRKSHGTIPRYAVGSVEPKVK
jgi:hypothetical protein